MRVVVTDDSHNRAEWHVRRPLPQILVGLLVAVLFLVTLVAFSPSRFRWPVVGATVGVGVAIAAIYVLTTPLVDGGSLDRQPDGGVLHRTKTWLLRGTQEVLSLDLGEVAALDLETRGFEDGPTDSHVLGRVWLVDRSGNRAPLTDWVEVTSAQMLTDVLTRAGRLVPVQSESQDEIVPVV